MNSFCSVEELKEIGLASIGENVLISRKASIYSPEKMHIGNNVRVDDFCILSGVIRLEDYIHIAAGTYLFGGTAGITIKSFSTISSHCSVYALTDDYSGETMTNPMIPDRFKAVVESPIIISQHVIIGTGCSILPGVNIGEGASVGAKSLVNKSLDAWCIYAGIPCRYLQERSKGLLNLEYNLRGCHE